MINVSDNQGKVSFSILHLVAIAYKKKFTILFTFFLITGIAVAYAFLASPRFSSSTNVLPVSESSQGSSMGLLGSLGANFGLSVKGNKASDKILTIIKSRNLAKKAYYKDKNLFNTELFPKAWNSQTQKWNTNPLPELIILGRIQGLIQAQLDPVHELSIGIKSTASSPEAAQKILKLFVTSLHELLNENDTEIHKNKQELVQNQLVKNKRDLIVAQKALKEFENVYQNGRFNNKVQINLENDTVSQINDKTMTETSIQVPEDIYIQYINSRKMVLQKINALLEQQYHFTKIDDFDKKLKFIIIEDPTLPKFRSFPKRKVIIVVGMMAGLFCGLFFAFLSYFLKANLPGFKTLFQNTLNEV